MSRFAHRYCSVWLMALSIGASLASPALAQDEHVGAITNDAIAGAHARLPGVSPPAEGAAPAGKMKPDLIVVPIPLSNPTLGSGVTLAGVLFYNPNGSKQPWVTGAGAMYTSNKSKGVAAFHSMSLAHDRFRVLAFGGFADINMNFYGIGPNAGDRGVSVDLNERGMMAVLQGQYRIAGNLYAGARYEFMDLNSKIKRENPLFPDLHLPQPELDSKLSAIGPAVTYDSRDTSFNPHKGVLLTAVGMFNVKGLGSDFSYDKWQFGANAFFPLRPMTTLAVRGSLCGVSKGGPFYDLCMYGMSGDLRGYESGRYRDHASWAVQAEFRQHLGGRFGAAFFGGVGGIATSVGEIGNSKLLPSIGAGLRYLASKEAGVNLRLDFATGRDSSAIYFGIGEAF